MVTDARLANVCHTQPGGNGVAVEHDRPSMDYLREVMNRFSARLP
jgi:hypothetical protein